PFARNEPSLVPGRSSRSLEPVPAFTAGARDFPFLFHIRNGSPDLAFGEAIPPHLRLCLVRHLLVWRNSGARHIDDKRDISRERRGERSDDPTVASAIEPHSRAIDVGPALQVVNPGQGIRGEVHEALLPIVAARTSRAPLVVDQSR